MTRKSIEGYKEELHQQYRAKSHSKELELHKHYQPEYSNRTLTRYYIFNRSDIARTILG